MIQKHLLKSYSAETLTISKKNGHLSEDKSKHLKKIVGPRTSKPLLIVLEKHSFIYFSQSVHDHISLFLLRKSLREAWKAADPFGGSIITQMLIFPMAPSAGNSN